MPRGRAHRDIDDDGIVIEIDFVATACHLSRERKLVTIRPLHRFFALCVFPFFSGRGSKVARSHNVGGKRQWDGVKHI
jgi:hypothetical protein